MIDQLRADLRYAVRQMGRAPLTTVVASLSVAIGIVVAVSAFSVLNAVMFKPLDMPGVDDLYHVYTSDHDGRDAPYGASSFADYQDFAKSGAFDVLAASKWDEAAVSVAGSAPSSEYLSFVSSNYFPILGLSPARGRWLSGDDAEIVITYPYWKRRFGGDAGVLGKTVQVNSVPLTVVGVAPESFRGVGLGPPTIGWAPASSLSAVMRDANALTNRGSRGFTVFGRLSAGTNEAVATSRLNALAAGLAQQEPGSWMDGNQETRLVSVLPHYKALFPPRNRNDMLLMIGAALLLIVFVVLLACTNVAALLIGRAVGRQHEIAVRLTLGATRPRILRQLLTESVLLAAIGGTIGFLGLLWTIRFVSALPVVDLLDLRADWRVLLVAAGTSLVCRSEERRVGKECRCRWWADH